MITDRARQKLIRREMAKLCKKRPPFLTPVPREEWSTAEECRDDGRIEAWVSSRFMAQVFDEGDGRLRVSVNRVTLNERGDWADNLTWDELMEVKRQIGRGDAYAVEVLPPDGQVVNVANMRHFWLLPEWVCGWKR